MTTPELETPVQPLFIAAYAFFVTGALLFIAAFVLTLPAHLFKSTLILSASFAALSACELLNHPKQKIRIFFKRYVTATIVTLNPENT